MSSIQFYWQCPKCGRRMPIEQVVHNCAADGTAVKRAIEHVWYDSSKFEGIDANIADCVNRNFADLIDWPEPDTEYTCPPCWMRDKT
jgi:hypothetical protein